MFLRKDNSIKWKWLTYASVLTFVLCMAGILGLDKPVYMFFRGLDGPLWKWLSIFNSEFWLVASFVAAVVVFVRTNAKTTLKFKIKNAVSWIREKFSNNYAFLVLCSVFTASVITGILKFILGRARPVFFEALDRTGFYPWNNEWAFNSMPSGHTTAGFAALVMIGMLFPKIKWATWTTAILIGVSRICIGAHFPSDVILGAFIGMVTADFVKHFFLKK